LRTPQKLDCVACTMHQCSVFSFPISQGNAEALDSTSANKYCNWIVYVEIIASQRWDFFETQCSYIIPLTIRELDVESDVISFPNSNNSSFSIYVIA